jgi:hypothetical protein
MFLTKPVYHFSFIIFVFKFLFSNFIHLGSAEEEKEKAFQRKLNYYGVNIYRKFSVENNAPFFRILIKRLFSYYKPSIRRAISFITAVN